MDKITFGPVPSRRLGNSLGINNIPYKHCSFSCIYCQIGRTQNFEYTRREYYKPELIIDNVISSVSKFGDTKIDYATFVPDGEPTLDINLGKEITEIKKKVNTKIAVITNASMIYKEDVRNDLYNADLVSLKIDAITMDIFKRVDRPHPKLEHDKILSGIKEFSENYKGVIITETMLIKNINDTNEELEKISNFISELKAEKIYIGVPTRPPAEKWAVPTDEQNVLKAYSIFAEKNDEEKIELLLGAEGPEFYNVSEDPIEGLLAITSVHPMRIDYIEEFFDKRGLEAKPILDKLVDEDKLVKLEYMDTTFYLRKIPPQKN
ncbi:MAG: radical SAM protein [Promethearchaeota archaeon]